MNFSDRINPIVVKELRQGLKSRSFIASFLGLQAAMVLTMLFYLSSGDSRNALQMSDGFFWFILLALLLGAMPLRAFQALHEELKSNTLEMLFLTRMNSWQITMGKWMAQALQCLLLLSAIFPYLVLRYYLGSVDLAQDLANVSIIIVSSLMFCAVGVGLSGWQTRLLRGLVYFGVVFLGFALLNIAGMSMVTGSSRSPLSSFEWSYVLLALSVAVLVIFFFVEYGASQIAPPAENHAIRKRAIAFGILLVFGAFGIYNREPWAMVLGFCMTLPICVDALCEPVLLIPGLYKSRIRFAPLRWLVMPGFATALPFICLMILIFLGLHSLCGPGHDLNYGMAFMASFTGLTFPIAVMSLIPYLSRRALPSYILLQVGALLFTLLLAFWWEMNDSSFGNSMDIPFSLSPIPSMIAVLAEEEDELNGAIMCIPFFLTILPLLLKVPNVYREMFRCRDSLKQTEANIPPLPGA